MDKRVLLTGAAGFIGFHLALALRKRGDAVLGFDNFNPYYSVQLKKDRANELKKAGVEIVDGDICHSERLETATKRHRTTHFVHLAAQAGVRYSLESPQAYVSSNMAGFVNVLEVCRRVHGIKLVYASSSSVYGLNTEVPFSEEDRTDHPASLYGVTKKANELMAFSYHHLFGIPSTGLRFFTVYGPWGRPDMAYYTFTQAIFENKPIELFNYGKMQRDFTYIDDVVEGTMAAIDRERGCEVFNLGNHQPVELMEAVQILEKAIGKKADLKMAPMQPGDVPATYADIEKSKLHLGFYPKTSFAEGIEQFVHWYRNYKKFK